MSSTVEQIKEILDISEVVGSYLKLYNVGSNFKAQCPFHNEKTPSFFVSPSRQTYHCFGCNRGGDIFSFVEEIEGVDFRGALQILANRAGVEIKKESTAASSHKEKLFSVLEYATKLFEDNLKKEKDVIEYLKNRGLSGKTAKMFRVGYALNQWGGLSDVLKNKGYSYEEMEKAGLVIKGKHGFYDRFRGRIMFPIADSSGRIVGFSGRIFESKNSDTGYDKQQAKYVNSPDTQLYNKSKILYGFDKAKVAIRKSGFCILVEGQMDLLMSHQAGLVNTVAVSGTSLTTEHLNLIKRFSDKLVIAFDADDAGIEASKRGVDSAISLGMDVKIVPLPDDSDPADLILKDEKEWSKQIKEAKHIIDFYIDVLAGKDLSQRDFRVKVGETVLPYVARIKNKIDQAHFVSEIARKLGISEDPIWDQLRGVTIVNENFKKNISVSDKKESMPKFSRKDMLDRKILGIIFWQEESKDKIFKIENIEDKFKKIINKIKKSNPVNEEKKKEYIFEAEVYYDKTEEIENELKSLLLYREEEVLKEEFTDTISKLRQAENSGDVKQSAEFLKQCQEISKKINNLK